MAVSVKGGQLVWDSPSPAAAERAAASGAEVSYDPEKRRYEIRKGTGATDTDGGAGEPIPTSRRVQLGASAAAAVRASRQGMVVRYDPKAHTYTGYKPEQKGVVQRQTAQRVQSIALSDLPEKIHKEYVAISKEKVKDLPPKEQPEARRLFSKSVELEAQRRVLERETKQIEVYQKEVAEGRVDVPPKVKEIQKQIDAYNIKAEKYNKEIEAFNKKIEQPKEPTKLEKFTSQINKALGRSEKPTTVEEKGFKAIEKISGFEEKYITPTFQKVTSFLSKTPVDVTAGTLPPLGKEVKQKFLTSVEEGIVYTPTGLAKMGAFGVAYSEHPEAGLAILGAGTYGAAKQDPMRFIGNIMGTQLFFGGAAAGIRGLTKPTPKIKSIEVQSTTAYKTIKTTQPQKTIRATETGKLQYGYEVKARGYGIHDLEAAIKYKPTALSRTQIHRVYQPKKTYVETSTLYAQKPTGKPTDLVIPQKAVSRFAEVTPKGKISLTKGTRGTVDTEAVLGVSRSKVVAKTPIGKETYLLKGKSVGKTKDVPHGLEFQRVGDKWYITSRTKGIGVLYKKAGQREIPYKVEDTFYGKTKPPKAQPMGVMQGRTKARTIPKSQLPRAETAGVQSAGQVEAIALKGQIKAAPKEFLPKSQPLTLSLKQQTGLSTAAMVGMSLRSRQKQTQEQKKRLKTAPVLRQTQVPTSDLVQEQLKAISPIQEIGLLKEQGQAQIQKQRPIPNLKQLQRTQLGTMGGFPPIETPTYAPTAAVPPFWLGTGKPTKKKKRDLWKAYNVKIHPIPTAKELAGKIAKGVTN